MTATVRKIVLSALFLVLSGGIASADFNSSTSTINMGLNIRENMNVQINFGNNFGQFQQNGGAPMPTTGMMDLTLYYNGAVNRNSVSVYAYVLDGGQALINGSGGAIPASNLQATITGVGVSVFNQPSPFSSFSVLLATSNAVAANGNGTLPASFFLSILGTNIPAGYYTGPLFIVGVLT